MTERDLSRPVVVVKDFHTDKPEYEIYTFGEQIVVAPVLKKERKKLGLNSLKVTPSQIQKVLKKYSVYDFDYSFDPPNSLTLYVGKKDKPRVIGKEGRKIEEIERKLGLSIDVRTFEEKEDAEFVIDVYPSKDKIHLVFPNMCIGKDVTILIDGKQLVQLTVGKTGEVSISKSTQIGKALLDAHNKGSTISVLM